MELELNDIRKLKENGEKNWNEVWIVVRQTAGRFCENIQNLKVHQRSICKTENKHAKV